MRIVTLSAVALVVFAAPALADISLAPIFGDDMVLQRDVPLRIWGTAGPGEEITVSFDHKTAKGKADDTGHWSIEFGPFLVTAARELTVEGSIKTVVGKNKIVLKGVCVGDVYVCSGQSNMAWRVKQSMNAAQEIEESLNPRLRYFQMFNRVSGEPQADFAKRQGGWKLCDPSTVGEFSAVAYFFARQVREDLGIPIGIIVSAWGGTPAEAWTRREALQAHDETQPILERWDKLIAEHANALENFKDAMNAWKDDAAKARKAGKRVPGRPRPPLGPGHPHRASGLWNGMIAPLTPLRIRGFLWYQGESNVGRAEQYATLFPAMIQDWRKAWGQGDLPFLFVQLANFRAVQREPVQSNWAELRDAQRAALKLPNTAMAVTIDIGEANNIHPKNKQDLGLRLALAARALCYRDEMEHKLDGKFHYSGPALTRFENSRSKARLSFQHLCGGLRTAGGDPLRGFTIAGKDNVFRLAHATIEGDQIIVWHPEVEWPAAVRYGWADNPICNLVNAAGLPASPFRTDSWPGLTAGKR